MKHRPWLGAACLLVGMPLTTLAAEDSDLTVQVPSGETRLADLGLYRVGRQSYGKEPAWMPPGWSGHFDDATGISCQSAGRILGREALLLHSPWRVPPGRTWVEYQLTLPTTQPIHFSFGIAMGPDTVASNKSDGVTFSCSLAAAGTDRELMRQHSAKAAWEDYSFDLSPHAGQTVTLRVQVEPGPKNNASFDYSYFGDAKITAGESRESTASVLQRLTTAPAYRALEQASLVALSNNPTNGIVPSNLLPYRNSLEAAGSAWRFVYQAADCRVVYSYEPKTGTLDDFTVQVDDSRVFQPALGGGVTVSVKQGNKEAAVPARGGKALQMTRSNDSLKVLWEYDLASQPLRVAWTFNLIGKALVVSARCDEPGVSAFSLGDVGMVPFRKTFPVPYFDSQVLYLPAQNVFVCRFLDWTVSNASKSPRGTATYDRKTDGTRNPLAETGYIAVAPDVGEVLPNIPFAPSPFLATLGPRVMLDIWGHHQGTYAGDAAKLRELKDNGVDHLAIIQHVWQRYGYDVKLPDHLPANPEHGGDEGMKLFGQTANDCGYLWSLHENYIDLYPDAPSYDPSARVLTVEDTPSLAWYNAGTKVQSFGLKCDRARGYAKLNSPEAHRRYGTSAGYLDVHTCVPPWHQLDHDATAPMAAMARAKVKLDSDLFQFERDTHGGPLFGEGADHFYWAGRCDGVEAQVRGGEDHAAFLDFELLKIHQQMVNHGMGYMERWFRRGYDAQYGGDAGSIEQLDKYRAMELAYGHAGFLGNRFVHTVQAVAREHHLMHPVQRLYGTAKPVEISYEMAGQFVTASAALVAGDTSRQRIRYDSGLTLWVNWRAEPWRVEGPKSEVRSPKSEKGDQRVAGLRTSDFGLRTLPQWGFLAIGPNTEVSTSLRDGKVADYAECLEYLFADARTWFDLPYRHGPKAIEPRLRSAEYLGSNKLRVTYEWIVNDTLGTNNYVCFVHGINAAATSSQGIVFQGDHALPKPTSQWRPGDVIVDGPHELVVSDQFSTYDLTIGLYRGERVRLQGVDEGGNRIVLARLKVEQPAGQITNITVEKVTSATRPQVAVNEADFKAHTNPSGTWIDFGPIATDGAVKINLEPDRLVVFPYPRDEDFRVSLDMKSLLPGLNLARLQVRVLAAGDQRDLGPAKFKLEDGRLTVSVGTPGAGRYAVQQGTRAP
jgi:hypothetical protein